MAIRVSIWVLGVLALIGNGFVIYTRMRKEPNSSVERIQSTFITNLAVSDFLTGVYMLILACMDIYIGESYFWEGRAQEWRSSISCQIAGLIALVSSEASVFLVTLISVDRFISILFLFSRRRFSKTSSRIACSVVWVISIFLGGAGTLLNYISPDAYSLSDVCVGLPLIRETSGVLEEDGLQYDKDSGQLVPTTTLSKLGTASTWLFSITVYLGINLVCLMAVLVCYIAIFVSVRITHVRAGRKIESAREIKMATKMSLIVGTDFCCWMPIIVLGIVVQAAGIEVTPDIYAWLVAFVLPINSSVNPFIYTIVEMISKRNESRGKRT